MKISFIIVNYYVDTLSILNTTKGALFSKNVGRVMLLVLCISFDDV